MTGSPPPTVRALIPAVVRPVGFAAALVASYLAFVTTEVGQWMDAGSFAALALVNEPWGEAAGVLRVAGPVVLAVACLVAGIVAAVHRRWVAGIASVLIVVLALALGEGMKELLPRPDLGGYGYPDNTFPSGHMTLAVSFAAALSVVLPPGRRGTVLAGTGIVLAALVGGASIVSYAHRPSDVVGAVLVTGLVLSCVLWRRPSGGRRYWWAVVLTTLLLAAGVLAVAVGRFQPGWAGDLLETAGWLAGCVALAPLAMVIAPAREPSPGS